MAKRCKTTRKRKYATYTEAIAVALHESGKRGVPLEVYGCPDCRRWHLTSYRARRAKRQASAGGAR